MRKLVKVVSSVVVALSLVGVSAQVASADSMNGIKLSSAEVVPTSASIKKGQKVIVVVKDTKKQTVSVYNNQAQKTNRTVKMGKTFTAKAVKRVNGKKIVRVNGYNWLNTKDLAQY